MTVIKDSNFPDRMRIKFLSDIAIEPDEIEYLIELAESAEKERNIAICGECGEDIDE